MTRPPEPAGRRAAHKARTRARIKTSAEQLFRRQGFAATTVAQIAAAADVTERTFFRYYASKDEVILEDAMTWIPVLADAVARRPASDGLLGAIEAALVEIAPQVEAAGPLSPLWFHRDGRVAIPNRPAVVEGLMRLEDALGDALRARLGSTRSADDDYLCDVWARCAVTVMRSVMIRRWQLRHEEHPPSLAALTRDGFAAIAGPPRDVPNSPVHPRHR